ncbi:MAG: di-trans,poly-cis-decaprenylcistransferase [Herpetosiphonaceae bacterium]|nr:di-trans,poly-cis-decaprenylcistransferase [Herpetosiphonaceae bacterium]
MAGPQHIAIIMDGNGRWARGRGLPRLAGHRQGTENVRRIVREAKDQGVRYLTIYAFSTENWKRPGPEVRGLMMLLGEFIDRETANLHAEGVQIKHLGSFENVAPRLERKIHDAVELTQHNTLLTLAVAFNYGGRADIVNAVRELIGAGATAEDITEDTISQHLYTHDMPDPDLIIRTGGDFRLSNFLIWQAAYSEYYMTPIFWPDFGVAEFREAIHQYGHRERRFGALPEASPNIK